MTIKFKLLGGGLTISLLLTAVLALALFSFNSLDGGFSQVVEKSQAGVANSHTTEGSIVAADKRLSHVSEGMLSVVEDIHRTNMQVKVLERKIKQISASLLEINKEASASAEDLPPGILRDALEDITDTLGDIDEIIRREALVNLSRTVIKMKEFNTNIGTQVDSIKILAAELGKVREVSADRVKANQQIRTLSENFSGEISLSRNVITGFLLLAVLLSMAGALLLSRSIIRPLSRANEITRGIADGDLNQNVNIESKDEIGQLGDSMTVMIKNLKKDIDGTRQRADETSRIKIALDNVSSSVMMADNERKIFYMNNSAHKLFQEAEEDIQKDLPNFRNEALIGGSIDDFHHHPEHQKNLLESLESRHEAEIKVGSRTMRFVANPVTNDSGERLDTAVEWTDRTAEVAVEAEVELIVAAAQVGDLSQRIDLKDKAGFFEKLGRGINSLIDQVEQIFTDMADILSAMARGDLTHPV